MSVTPTAETVTTAERAAWVQAWASIITVLLTVAGLWFVFTQIGFAKEQYLAYTEERKSERLEALSAEWASPTMLFYRAGAAKAYPKGSPHLSQVFMFYERLARAQKQGIVSSDDLHYYFGDGMLAYWCGWEPWVKQKRAEAGEDPEKGELWRGFQTSVAQMKAEKNMQCLTAAEVKNILWFEQDRYEQLVVAAPKAVTEAASSK